MITLRPGAAFALSVQLPKAYSGPVAWAMRDPHGEVVVRGTASATGSSAPVSGTLPATVDVPVDGSPFVLVVASKDGGVASQLAVSVVGDDEETVHGSEVAYVAGKNFSDTLYTDLTITAADVTVYNGVDVVASGSGVASNRGGGKAWKFTSGPLSFATGTTYGTGTTLWTFADDEGNEYQEVHAIYAITPYSLGFLNVIRKLVDRARVGDAHRYLEVTMTDLAHALLRGADYVASAPPYPTVFNLDGLPTMLRDFITKAGALDLLRSLQLAEGLSAFDFSGLGVQLNVDRSAHYGDTISQLQADIEKVGDAKKQWMAAGAPMGAVTSAPKRAIGVLGLTTGVYSNMPQRSFPFVYGAGGFYGFGRYGQSFGF